MNPVRQRLQAGPGRQQGQTFRSLPSRRCGVDIQLQPGISGKVQRFEVQLEPAHHRMVDTPCFHGRVPVRPATPSADGTAHWRWINQREAEAARKRSQAAEATYDGALLAEVLAAQKAKDLSASNDQAPAASDEADAVATPIEPASAQATAAAVTARNAGV